VSMVKVYSRCEGDRSAFEDRDGRGTDLAGNLARAVEEKDSKLFDPNPD